LINKEQFINRFSKDNTIWKLMEKYNCCKNTIKNYLKRYNLKAPKGFYVTGRKIGKPKRFTNFRETKKIHE